MHLPVTESAAESTPFSAISIVVDVPCLRCCRELGCSSAEVPLHVKDQYVQFHTNCIMPFDSDFVIRLLCHCRELGCSSAEVLAELRYNLPATMRFHK
jgi:hypothetical protein